MKCSTRRGFTLVESLVVISSISLLIALLLPAVQSAGEVARRLQCSSNMKQVGLGMHSYLSSLNTFPPGYVSLTVTSLRQILPLVEGAGDTLVIGDDASPGWSGHAMILPYLEQKSLYDQINFNVGVDRAANSTSIGNSLSVFQCPSDSRSKPLVSVPDRSQAGVILCSMASSNIIMNVGTVRPTCRKCRDSFDGVFGRNIVIGPADIIDGLSQSFGGGERAWKWSSSTIYGVAPFSKILDNTDPGKFALGPAYVLGTTFNEGFNSRRRRSTTPPPSSTRSPSRSAACTLAGPISGSATDRSGLSRIQSTSAYSGITQHEPATPMGRRFAGERPGGPGRGIKG